MIDQEFGELTVIRNAGGDKWLCQCSHGNFTVVLGTLLRTGLVKSCKSLEILSKESTNYRNMYDWIKRNKPRPELCERCKEKPITGLYRKKSLYLKRDSTLKKYRRTFDDYEWLCKSCQTFKFVKDRIITTEDAVYEIRKLYARGAYSQKELAALFSLDRTTVNHIIRYEGIYSREEEVI